MRKPTHQSLESGLDVVAWKMDPSQTPPPWVKGTFRHQNGQWIYRHPSTKREVVLFGVTGDWIVTSVDETSCKAYILHDQEFHSIFRELRFTPPIS